jgi:methylated-DNA-protein-cysteine methyltransferase-like protein
MARAKRAVSDSADPSATILAVVRRIPRGRVSTYGIVAERAGLPRRARLVGRVLSTLPANSAVPWHRVVAAGGRVAFPAGSAAHRAQCRQLGGEGVATLRGRVDLQRHGWQSGAGDLDRLLWHVGDGAS